MFAWIDLFYIAGGIALGIAFKDKIEAALHGAEGYAATLEAKLTAAKATVQADATKVQADVKNVEATVTTDVNAVKAAAATVQKAV